MKGNDGIKSVMTCQRGNEESGRRRRRKGLRNPVHLGLLLKSERKRGRKRRKEEHWSGHVKNRMIWRKRCSEVHKAGILRGQKEEEGGLGLHVPPGRRIPSPSHHQNPRLQH